jgi:hypothetical protein
MSKTFLGAAILGAALTCEAFMPSTLAPISAGKKLALSAPAARPSIRRSGALDTRAHIDPSSVHHVADMLQVRAATTQAALSGAGASGSWAC